MQKSPLPTVVELYEMDMDTDTDTQVNTTAMDLASRLWNI